jgi:uncharacterized caspase-like protein
MIKILTFLCAALLILAGCSLLGTGDGTAFHALVIGINDYIDTDINDLSWCVSDATGMRQVLLQRGWKDEEITLLLDDEATKDRILSEVQSIADACGTGDYILIYYSGHGTNISDASGDESDGSDEAIVPVDFNTDNISTLLLDDELGSAVSRCRTEKGVFIFDSCNSGGFIASSLAEESGMRSRYIETSGTRGTGSNGDLDIVNIPILAASAEDEDSFEYDNLQHGVFTYFLLDAVSGLTADKNVDGYISIRELFHYAEIQTEYYTLHYQNPQLRFSREFLDILITR